MEDLDDEILGEFLVETAELFARLDIELVELETAASPELIASIFRSVHTIKGAAGFLGLQRVEGLSHEGENLLARLRDGAVELTPMVVTGLLACVDALRAMMALVAAERSEGTDDYAALRTHLASLASGAVTPAGVEEPATDGASPDPQHPADSADLADDADIGDADTDDADIDDEDAVDGQDLEDLASLESLEDQDVAPESPAAPAPASAAPAAPTAPSAPRAEPGEGGPLRSEHETIRVDVAVLDELMNVVSELVLTRNQMRSLLANGDGPTQAALNRLSLLTGDLQSSVMKTRMQPISNLFGKFPRIVRDLAAQLGKQVTLEQRGGDTELDRTLIEAIKDPLTHLVRNAVDHGIESPEVREGKGKPRAGTLTLSARHDSGQVRVEISDDGAGLDLERIRDKAVTRGLIPADAILSESDIAALIFLPGFSTAETLTNVSGRGVGMDVVKTHIERIGGSVTVYPRPGGGTTIAATIPLTLAIMPSLLVSCDGWRYAVPQSSVEELVRVAEDDLEDVGGAMVLRLRDQLLPLVNLAAVLGRDGSGASSVVVVKEGPLRFGLLVDAAPGSEEVVVKPLDPLLAGIGVYAGATIMGDGGVALILDIAGIAGLAGVRPVEQLAATAVAEDDTERVPVVFFRDGGRTVAVGLRQVDRLEEFTPDQVQVAAGRSVVRYRGGLLPLVELSGRALSDAELIQVVVVHAEGTELGLVGVVVDDVLDIASAPVIAAGDGFSVSAEVLVGDQVTDVMDISAITGGHR